MPNLSDEALEHNIIHRVKKLAKAAGFTEEQVKTYLDEFEGHFDPAAYRKISDLGLLIDFCLYHNNLG